VGVKHLALVALAAALPLAAADTPEVPPQCTVHTSFSDGADVANDYRCAGLAIAFHTAGVAHSPSPLWAGQWLFVDQAGAFRMGTCTFNRGTHPTIASASSPVAQRFPNDPTGGKGAYLSWRYGGTTDPLTAAALWAVFHHYALDAAGSNRSANPDGPLIPRLDGIAAATGRDDLQQAAMALDAEAQALQGDWSLTVDVGVDGAVTATLLAGERPVADREVEVLVSGDDVSRVAVTGADGRATVTVPLPSGTVTVAVTTEAPGAVQAYRGAPASPNPLGGQTLVVAGPPRHLQATASVEVPAPTTTTAPPTTVAATTTTTPVTTVASTTSTSTTVAALPPTTIAPSTTAPAPHPPLPTTGRGGDGVVAQFATAFLVGGIGLLGTLRRRARGSRAAA
jgi:hypothetical protein